VKIQDLKHKSIAILWFWKEGKSSLKFLWEQGIENITILDQNEPSEEYKDIKCIFWDTYLDNLGEYDIIIKSPGISPFWEKLLPYRDKFISQTQIFFSNYTGKVIGITGTKGKSTCSTLLYSCLKEWWYDVKLVWNIGLPVLDEIDFYWDVHDYVVYELSSYMLQDFTPNLDIALLNNIYPCHLDWHYDSFNIYREAKVNILRNSRVSILHGDLLTDSEILWLNQSEKVSFDSKWLYSYNSGWFFIWNDIVYSGSLKLQWDHNRSNICGIIAMLDEIIQDYDILRSVLHSVLPNFSWLPNRIEDIWSYEGIRFINDAIATTPESTIAAIATFSDSLQTLFLWGEDSGFSFESIRSAILNSDIQNLVAFPDTSEKIFPEIELRDYEQAFELEIEGKILQVFKTRSMRAWVDFCYKTTLPWKIALLSCAAPSFSLWNDYLEKAEEFKKYVQEY